MPQRIPSTKALLTGLTFVVGLAGGAVLVSAPAQAQLVVEPAALSVTVPQYETETRAITLTNTGSEALSFCLNFDRPLQRVEGMARLAGGSAPCGNYGEVLYRLDEDGASELGWDPSGITMTPEGRLFTSSSSGFPWRTF